MSKPIPRIKEFRDAKNLTQRELAEKSGVTIGVISKAEGGGKISLGSIKKLAKALNVNPDNLIGEANV